MRPGLIALLLVAATACGGGDEVPESSSPDATVVSQSPAALTMEDVEKYFDASSKNTVDGWAEALDLAAGGSLAHAYAFHQQQVTRAYVESGEQEPASTVTQEGDDGLKVCDSDKYCAVYSDFESKGGELASFTIDGKSIAKRISVGKGKPQRVGSVGSVRFLSAYKAAAGDLFVVVEAKALGSDLDFGTYSAVYRSPNGRQMKVSASTGGELIANSVSNQVMVFPTADLGGTVLLEVYDADYNTVATIKLATA